ncbi:hypothetical protein TeGR_g9533 [Tetraparma gracilis]|uniref:Tubulin-specific chaperone A n=1 Tax=Tetraparma gracilis TaxID=2962635 RepID=A0ABQ6NA34_9STRA|nr:hypothetical protein TeGR_g9533 [Tetraparma gracilis]
MPTDRQKRDAKKDYPRQLMIMTKSVQRMMKEVGVYEKEVVDNTAKLAAIKEDSLKDEFDYKNFENVLAESVMMVPDSKARLATAVEELAVFVQTAKDEAGVQDSEWWAVAGDLVSKENSAANDVQATAVDVAEGEAF